MKILFIGGMFPENSKAEILNKSKGVIQFAANNFQWAFVRGLDNYFRDLSIFTAPSLGSFPKYYKKLFISGFIFSHNTRNDDYSSSFVNLPIIGLISKVVNLYRLLVATNKNTNPYLLVYSVHTPFLLPAVLYKFKYPKSKICLIVPDLPEYMSSKTNYFYKLLKYIDLKIINYLVKHVDSFVFITDEMSTRFNVGSKRWVRIEGIYDLPINNVRCVDNNVSNKTILYSGTLDSRYGILDLLEAFKLINHAGYSLWICGDGNMKNKVIEQSMIDNRITYFGQLTTSEVNELQKKTTVVVNPRTSKGDYTRYSFPIKTMEYLASGKPTIMHMLPGIPPEYRKYLFVPETETPLGLRNKIIEVCSADSQHYLALCEAAQRFIINEKNALSQTKKIFEMLNSDIGNRN